MIYGEYSFSFVNFKVVEIVYIQSMDISMTYDKEFVEYMTSNLQSGTFIKLTYNFDDVIDSIRSIVPAIFHSAIAVISTSGAVYSSYIRRGVCVLHLDVLRIAISACRVNSMLKNECMKLWVIISRNLSTEFSSSVTRIVQHLPRVYIQEESGMEVLEPSVL